MSRLAYFLTMLLFSRDLDLWNLQGYADYKDEIVNFDYGKKGNETKRKSPRGRWRKGEEEKGK